MTEDELRELLARAGRRPEPPAEDLAAIRAATREAWERRYARRSRWPWILAAAAVVLIAIGIASLMPPPHTPATIFETGPDQRYQFVVNGRSVRLDHSTRVRQVSASVFALERGAVYVDSIDPAGPLTIRTAAGDFIPIGTQFEVRVGDTTELRVREGRVRFSSTIVNAGQTLTIRNGSVVRGTIAPYDASWSWAVDAAPKFEIEGKTLRAYLDWVSRESGRKIEFADARAASLSETTILHGSIAGLSFDDGLRTVMLSTGFEAEAKNGALVISAAPRSNPP